MTAPRYTLLAPPVRHETVLDNTTGLEWQATPFDKRMTWAEAEAACKALRLGGHDDWRLPTRAELLTLVDDTRVNPAIDPEAFPGTPSEWFWTSTPSAASPSEFAWIVYFFSGHSLVDGRSYSLRVRAVRGSSRQSSASLEG